MTDVGDAGPAEGEIAGLERGLGVTSGLPLYWVSATRGRRSRLRPDGLFRLQFVQGLGMDAG
jgi:hypothetical protein